MEITAEYYPFEVWSITYVHILFFVNNQKKAYVRACGM